MGVAQGIRKLVGFLVVLAIAWQQFIVPNFTYRFTCSMQVRDVAGATNYNIGHYECAYVFTPGGLMVVKQAILDGADIAAAVAAGLRWSGNSNLGYGVQYAAGSGFTKARAIGIDATPFNIALTNTEYHRMGGTWALYHPRVTAVASGACVLCPAGTSTHGPADAAKGCSWLYGVQAAAGDSFGLGGGYPKIYWNIGGDVDLAAQAGDIFMASMSLMFTDRGGLESAVVRRTV